MSDGGKGSSRRPLSISQAEYESRWDAIFGRDLKKEEDQKIEEEEFEYVRKISEINSEMDKVTRYNKETQEVKRTISR